MKKVPEGEKNTMRHRSYDRLGCPVEACTEAIGGKWKGELLFILLLQLRELEEDGIIERKVYPVVPPKVEYSICKRGESLKPIIDAMWEWGKNFLENLPKERLKPKPKAKGKE